MNEVKGVCEWTKWMRRLGHHTRSSHGWGKYGSGNSIVIDIHLKGSKGIMKWIYKANILLRENLLRSFVKKWQCNRP